MKIFLDTIGCRLNQAEIETLARQFRSAGHEIVPTAEAADLAVINTCAVTSEAAADSRAAVRRARRQGAGGVIVTGCWATLEPEKAALLPGVQKIISNLHKDDLAANVLGLPAEAFDLEPVARQPIPGARQRTRAFIKVQDGCNNACTFCITTVARGASRSRSIETVLADIRTALDGGTKEIVLTGVHLGSWGQDLAGQSRLTDLISAILARTSVPRLRLSSLEPWDLDPEFFQLWSDPRLCRHLHLPLQSGSASVLRRMARKTTPEGFASLVASARSTITDVAITTDVIAGFPGETDEEFAQTLRFVQSLHFAGGHVFTYSTRPGTAAARMKAQVSFEVRKARNAALRDVFARAERDYQSKFLGQSVSVLWESSTPASGASFRLEGLSDNYLRVSSTSAGPRWNQVDDVQLKMMDANGIHGDIRIPVGP
jgi:threonylcarbamoyladenosine tRNA methylthiotransferase MtaB